jgi:hypothetical protein
VTTSTQQRSCRHPRCRQRRCRSSSGTSRCVRWDLRTVSPAAGTCQAYRLLDDLVLLHSWPRPLTSGDGYASVWLQAQIGGLRGRCTSAHPHQQGEHEMKCCVCVLAQCRCNPAGIGTEFRAAVASTGGAEGMAETHADLRALSVARLQHGQLSARSVVGVLRLDEQHVDVR